MKEITLRYLVDGLVRGNLVFSMKGSKLFISKRLHATDKGPQHKASLSTKAAQLVSSRMPFVSGLHLSKVLTVGGLNHLTIIENDGIEPLRGFPSIHILPVGANNLYSYDPTYNSKSWRHSYSSNMYGHARSTYMGMDWAKDQAPPMSSGHIALSKAVTSLLREVQTYYLPKLCLPAKPENQTLIESLTKLTDALRNEMAVNRKLFRLVREQGILIATLERELAQKLQERSIANSRDRDGIDSETDYSGTA